MVSVVVLTSKRMPEPLYNDLFHQTYKDFEIIIAKEKGIVNAMNIAISKCKGEIAIRIDDDVKLPHTWLEELIKQFSYPNVAGVTGPTYITKDRRNNRDSIRWVYPAHPFISWLMDYQELWPAKILRCGSVSYGSNFGDWSEYAKYEIDHLEGTNWAMRTELIRKVGGFDPTFDGVAEWFDTDVEFKIKKLGYKLVYNPKAYLYHMLEKGSHYNERFDGFGRIKNWLRFHIRHSKFHPKMIIWFCLMIGYFAWKKFR